MRCATTPLHDGPPTRKILRYQPLMHSCTMFPMYCVYREVFSPKCARGSSVGLQWHYLSGQRGKSPEVSLPSEPGNLQNAKQGYYSATCCVICSVVRGPPWSARKGRFTAEEIGRGNCSAILYCTVLYSTVQYLPTVYPRIGSVFCLNAHSCCIVQYQVKLPAMTAAVCYICFSARSPQDDDRASESRQTHIILMTFALEVAVVKRVCFSSRW